MRLTLRERVFGSTEDRSLPPAENELPLLAAYTASAVTPIAALAIADVWAAVRVLADAASRSRCTSTGRPAAAASGSPAASWSTSSSGPAPGPRRPTSSRR